MANNDRGHTRNRRSGSVTTGTSYLGGEDKVTNRRGKEVAPTLRNIRRMVGENGTAAHVRELERLDKYFSEPRRREAPRKETKTTASGTTTKSKPSSSARRSR